MSGNNSPPVLFVVFSRSNTTRRVLEALRQAKVPRLWVAADGPRADRPGEADRVAEVRRLVLDGIDWPCQVRTQFQGSNLGLRRGLVSAISWFMEEAGEGIILEDDCLPSPDWFLFAQAMLDKFRDCDEVGSVNGTTFVPFYEAGDWYFSRYNHVWGWATWKRAWAGYQAELQGWRDWVHVADKTQFWDSAAERKYWVRVFQQVESGESKTWDYQWTYSLWKANHLTIAPRKNMVSNLGFGEEATHTVETNRNIAEKTLEFFPPPYSGPEAPERQRQLDRWVFRNIYWGRPWDRFVARLKKAHRNLFGPG